MKKQLLLSFLAGLVMPLILAAAFQKSPPVSDVESDALSPTRAAEPGDGAAVLTVKNRSGNLQQITLEDYLVGVVLAEMPADFESEALRGPGGTEGVALHIRDRGAFLKSRRQKKRHHQPGQEGQEHLFLHP